MTPLDQLTVDSEIQGDTLEDARSVMDGQRQELSDRQGTIHVQEVSEMLVESENVPKQDDLVGKDYVSTVSSITEAPVTTKIITEKTQDVPELSIENEEKEVRIISLACVSSLMFKYFPER